jgi:DNA polymerase I-like protein with 3'-5' exonuclease and polymerase domains
MARRDVPKVLQNSLYDNFILSYGFGILIRNVAEDTMLKGWEIYSELPKGLGTQASIWTREPYYKFERKSDDSDILYRYCAKDSAVTLEICQNQDSVLEGSGLTHYRKNVEMLNPLLYMELRGIKYDQENVTKKLAETHEEIQKVGETVNQIAGTELRGTKGSLSAKRLAAALYDKLGYPKQYKKFAYGTLQKTAGVKKLTTDIEALLTLRKRQSNDRFLDGILKHRHLEGLIETLSIKCDPDGRVRCGYNVVGTETGRLTCYTSPTGAGANLQTITKKLRNNYVADDGYEMFQCDLAGADGWTVAAHCARLGDPTMLEDLQGGVKIAKVIVLLYQLGVDINKLDRDSLANAIRAVDSDGWEYFACKRVQHATNYLVGVPTLCAQVMKDSFKWSGEPIYLEHAQGRAFQDLYKSRYRGLELYHSWAHSKLLADGLLTSASGHTRVFFGRRFGTGIHETIKEFLADEPQQNTTWATNLAMLNLWNDPENRRANGSLIIEPLHQVHDALVGQWPVAQRDWARNKVKGYFNNVLKIAGIDITIPFEGRYGRSWGELNNEL